MNQYGARSAEGTRHGQGTVGYFWRHLAEDFPRSVRLSPRSRSAAGSPGWLLKSCIPEHTTPLEQSQREHMESRERNQFLICLWHKWKNVCHKAAPMRHARLQKPQTFWISWGYWGHMLLKDWYKNQPSVWNETSISFPLFPSEHLHIYNSYKAEISYDERQWKKSQGTTRGFLHVTQQDF